MMQLWTWQGREHSLTSGYVDHTLSDYYDFVEGVRDAYAELAKRLGTNQIIWCVASRDQFYSPPEQGKVEWILEVPDDRILRIIDTFIWNKILDIKTYPQSLYRKWSHDAMTQEGNSAEYCERKVEEYHSQPEPDGGWWSELFITDATLEGANVLLRHPIPESWVVSNGAGIT